MAVTQLRCGSRVVRGPDWPLGSDEDGGEGSVGTLVEVPGQNVEGGNSAAANAKFNAVTSTPPDTVVVQWDNGVINTYRCGANGKYELRLLDTAPAGSWHSGVVCDGCGSSGIAGLRWQCRECSTVSLCSECYRRGQREVDHRFCAISFPGVTGFSVGVRNQSLMTMAKGIYPGAKVCRHPSANVAQSQPGTADTSVVGTVAEVCGVDGTTSKRSMAVVIWPGGKKEICAVGHAGKVELLCVEVAKGSYYYKEHLPPVGFSENRQQECLPAEDKQHEYLLAEVDSSFLCPGRLVHVPDMDVEILTMFQEQVRSSHIDFSKILHLVGEVRRVDEQRSIVDVFYPTLASVFSLHQAVISLIPVFRVGARVSVVGDPRLFTAMMSRTDLPEPRAQGRDLVGLVGALVEYRSDHAVCVTFDNGHVVLHPACIVRAGDPAADLVPLTTAASIMPPGSTRTGKPDLGGGPASPAFDYDTPAQPLPFNITGWSPGSAVDALGFLESDALCSLPPADLNLTGDHPRAAIGRAISSGRHDTLRDLLGQHPDLVNAKTGSRSITYGHIAVLTGDAPALDILKESGLNLDSRDSLQNTSLFVATLRGKLAMADRLLQLGARSDIAGTYRAHPLHIACARGNLEMVNCLLRHGAALDPFTESGNTPLHEAIRRDRGPVAETLMEAGANLEIQGSQELNAAQLATFHNSIQCLRRILRRFPAIAYLSLSEHGRTLLHMAAINNFALPMQMLLETPGVDIDALGHGLDTPLLVAVSQGGRGCSEMLVAHGARLDLADNDGNTALHIAVGKLTQYERGTESVNLLPTERDPASMAPKISEIQTCMPFGVETVCRLAAIACFLAQQGGDLNYMNNMGVSTLMGCHNEQLTALLLAYQAKAGSSTFHGSKAHGRSASSSHAEPDHSQRAAVSLASSQPVESPAVPAQNNLQVSTPYQDNRDVDSTLHTPAVTARAKCCVLRCTEEPCVFFQPCGHMVTCRSCCFNFNLCRSCHAIVEGLVLQDGTNLSHDDPPCAQPAGAPSSGNSAPSSGNSAPSSGNSAPSSGSSAPSPGRSAPSSGSSAPSSGSSAPGSGSSASSSGSSAPSAGGSAAGPGKKKIMPGKLACNFSNPAPGQANPPRSRQAPDRNSLPVQDRPG